MQNIREQDIVPKHRVDPVASREHLELRSDILIFPLIEVRVLIDLVGEAAPSSTVNYNMIVLQDVYFTF